MERLTKRPLSCPLNKPVSVVRYVRFRNGKWEQVCEHCRGRRHHTANPGLI